MLVSFSQARATAPPKIKTGQWASLCVAF